MLKHLFSTAVLLALMSRVFAQSLVPVPAESVVEFRIRNFGIGTTGTFKGLEGKIVFEPANLGTAAMDVSVDANTVDTDNNTRDSHLRKEEYFDVKNYPRIRFVSTRVARSSKAGIFVVYGKLTIKKTTKDISFPFTAEAISNGYRFKADFRINRRDFGVGGNSTISDNLYVCLNVIARRS
jgi:polyisoprenoid-binding protein YceI